MKMNKIFLRGFEENDYILINQWRNDSEIQHLVSAPFRYVPLAIEKEWVKQKMLNNTYEIYLAICLNNETHRMIGYTSINEINFINRTAHGGGIIIGDKEFRDGEIKHEVSVLLRKHIFEDLNLNRLTGACLEEHTASIVMMLAAGYKLEGVKRQAIYKDGTYHNQLFFSLLKEDYEELLKNGQYILAQYAKRILTFRKQIRTNGKFKI